MREKSCLKADRDVLLAGLSPTFDEWNFERCLPQKPKATVSNADNRLCDLAR